MADQEDKAEQQEEQAEAAADAAEESPADGAEAPVEAAASDAAEEAPAPAEEAPEAEAEAAAEPAPEAAKSESAEAEAKPEPEPEPEKVEYTFEVLHKMTVSDLRDIAQSLEHEALAGYSTMHKEQLVPALCEALGIEAHVHHEVVGINKAKVKARINDLKVLRAQAIEAGDHAQLKQVRSRIKSLKRKIRRATI